jgi:hypothetical protein
MLDDKYNTFIHIISHYDENYENYENLRQKTIKQCSNVRSVSKHYKNPTQRVGRVQSGPHHQLVLAMI